MRRVRDGDRSALDGRALASDETLEHAHRHRRSQPDACDQAESCPLPTPGEPYTGKQRERPHGDHTAEVGDDRGALGETVTTPGHHQQRRIHVVVRTTDDGVAGRQHHRRGQDERESERSAGLATLRGRSGHHRPTVRCAEDGQRLRNAGDSEFLDSVHDFPIGGDSSAATTNPVDRDSR